MPAPHVYQLTVTTGSMFGAGTTSRVAFQLEGSEGKTAVKMLNPGGEALIRGSTLHFVLPVRESLGEVMLLHIWHDNSGEGDTSSWFLGSFVVRDVEKDVVHYFTCNDWLSEHKGDGELQKVVCASTKKELSSFSNVFNEATRDVFYDKQLWASAIVAAPGSSFTQAQRLSCCFTLLNTMMLASAMWYGTETTTAGTAVFDLGFVRFTREDLYITLMTILTVFPVNLIIVQLFRMEAPLIVSTPEMTIGTSKQMPKKLRRPAKVNLKSTKKKKELNNKSASTLMELFLLFAFVTLLFYIAQMDKDTLAFHERQTLPSNILNEYDAIRKPDQLYSWLEEVLLPTLHPSSWYNGRQMRYLDRQFAHNTAAFRIGPARLAQMRQHPGAMTKERHAGRGWDVQPAGNTSCTSWRFLFPTFSNHPNYSSDCKNIHSLNLPLDYDIAVSFINALKDSEYLDKYTKSFTIDINFYNPSLKLFSVVHMVLDHSGDLGFQEYVDLTTAAWWDACFKHVLGIAVFINTISLLRIVRFSQTIGKLLALPGIMKEELLSFLVVTVVAFMAFISSGYLVFGSHIESYSDMYQTTYALFEMMLGRFFANEMLDSNPITGPIFFSTFMICIFILLMNFLMTIICDAISADVDVTHDRELADHVWRSFKAMLGFHSPPNNQDKTGASKIEELQANLRLLQEGLDESLDICNSILPRDSRSRLNVKVPSFQTRASRKHTCPVIDTECKVTIHMEPASDSDSQF
uniref:PLAT domain-containing protein n=1 Tax=Branchiostoma floridae TaxID=7739 RepID=C3ZJK4_BRAFL|eukprot:XP_002591335.1 hypothetical protein BRAFLDRAFT_76809 [Branchiostoma floridae]